MSGEAGRNPALTRNRRPFSGGRAGAPTTGRPEHTLSRNAAGGCRTCPGRVLPVVAAGRKPCASFVPWPGPPRPPLSSSVGLVSAPTQAASTYDPGPPSPAPPGSPTRSPTDLSTTSSTTSTTSASPSTSPSVSTAPASSPRWSRRSPRPWPRTSRSTPSFAPSITPAPTAKAAVLALSQDKDPHAFGGVDLVEQLEGRVAASAPITGRIEDAYDPTDEFGGDFANVIGQAYAAQALSLVGSAKATSATAFLLRSSATRATSVSTSPATRPAPTSPARAPLGRSAVPAPTPPRWRCSRCRTSRAPRPRRP